jgi:chemotaxis protein CheX
MVEHDRRYPMIQSCRRIYQRDNRKMDLTSFNLASFLRTATQDVFETMLSMELGENEGIEALPPATRQVVGSVSMAGAVSGTVNIYVSDMFARVITADMLGMDLDEVDSEEEIHDVVGELSNMIGGDLKSRLCDAGFECRLSIPSITSGKDFQIESKGWAINEQVFFEYQDHIALIEAFLKNGS